MAGFTAHSEQQARALKSAKPIVLLACGIQFGKTVVGAWRVRKAALTLLKDRWDSILVTAPTYKISSQSTLPQLKLLLSDIAEYHRQDSVFELRNGALIYIRTATDPDSIVGITNVRFVYGDEAGLYSLYFWENIQARAAFKKAQILLTTSPYTLNWVYKDLIRPNLNGKNGRPDVDYIKARSIDNPHFPRDYYERMRQTMDERRFSSMFGGEWNRNEGLVYDCFDEDANSVTPFILPKETRYYAGVDFGHTNPFAVAVLAITPTGERCQLTEVYKTGLTLLDMIGVCKRLKQYYPIEMFYCDPSQPGYIEEFNRAGLIATGANNDIQLGISLLYEMVKSRRYRLFRGDNKYTIDELETYHYPSPDEIKPDKDVNDRIPVAQDNHLMDALRYVNIATYTGMHRQPPKVISRFDDEGKRNLTIDERRARVFEGPSERYEEL